MSADQNVLASVTIGGLFSDLFFFNPNVIKRSLWLVTSTFFKNKEIEDKIECIKLYDKKGQVLFHGTLCSVVYLYVLRCNVEHGVSY